MKFTYHNQQIDFPDDLSEENKQCYHSGTFYEVELLEYIRSLRIGGVYIDVGSHIGNHAIYFSLFCKSQKVYAFEPLKAFFTIAHDSIQKNVPEGKCDLLNFGLSDVIGSEQYLFQDIEEAIELETMDGVLDHVHNACVIRIDFEGFNTAVLRGGRNFIRRCKPLIFAKVHNDDKYKEVCDVLTGLGYIPTGKVFNRTPTYEFMSLDKGHKKYFDVASYWEDRYAQGKDSGSGSYDRLALFKANFLNEFIAENNIYSVTELGCGDGAQLGLNEYPKYIGLDISQTSIEKCKKIFQGDTSKTFFYYQPDNFHPDQYVSDISISLDVIYHLSDDHIYEEYLTHLFSLGRYYVIIYSNSEEFYSHGVNERSEYVRFRNFLKDITQRFPSWKLVDAVPNRYPFNTTLNTSTSFADFYIFKKRPNPDEIYTNFDSFHVQKNTNMLLTAAEQSDLIHRELRLQRKDFTKKHSELIKLFDNHTQSEQKVQNLEQKLQDTENQLDQVIREKSEIEEFVTSSKQNLQNTEQQLYQALKEKNDLEKMLVSSEQKLQDKEQQLGLALKEKEEAKAQLLKERKYKEVQQQISSSKDKQIKSLIAKLQERSQARDRAALNYHRVRHRLQNQTKTVSHQLGQALVQAVTKPGMNTVALSYRLGRLAIHGLSKRIRPTRNPEAFSVLLKLPDGREEFTPFTVNKPKYVKARQDRVTFALPEGHSAYLSSRRTAAFDKPPTDGLVALEPDTRYVFAGQLEVQGSVQIWLMEYDLDGRIADHKLTIFDNSFSLEFQTHAQHKQLVISYRILGSGFLGIPAVPWTILEPKADPAPAPKDNLQSNLKQEISILGWPDPPDNNKPRVLSIMDEFTTGCFNKDVNLIQPRPDNWFGLAEKYEPSLIFIESAWKGNFGSWQYRVGEYANKPGDEVAELAAYGRKKNVPVIFWNKEDPVHHEKFMPSAKQADIIFTTDANMIDSYRQKTFNQNVFALPFAAQPALHKPRPLNERMPKACFAGSWYGGRHKERGEAMQWLLEVARPLGLEIFDRNHGTGIFPFPNEYADCIRGSLPYEKLCQEYGRYRVFLNVNSVTDSPTMFSRRVFELMACGTPVVSTSARGIKELLGTDAVWLVRNAAEARQAIETLLNDDQEWRARSLAGIRQVFARHTYKHRLQEIFEKTGLHYPDLEPKILLVANAHSSQEMDLLAEFARNQSWTGFILCVNAPADFSQDQVPEKIKLFQNDSFNTYDLSGIMTGYDLVGPLDPSAGYGAHYLQDIVNATRYAPEAKAWGKSVQSNQFAYAQPVYGMACLYRVSSLDRDFSKLFTLTSITDPDIFCLDSDQFEPAQGSKVQEVRL